MAGKACSSKHLLLLKNWHLLQISIYFELTAVSVAPSSILAHVMPLVSMTVRELVVSAGVSVEVTLPRNEVELNAFVVPAPQPGTTTQPTCVITSSYCIIHLYYTHPV